MTWLVRGQRWEGVLEEAEKIEVDRLLKKTKGDVVAAQDVLSTVEIGQVYIQQIFNEGTNVH